MGRNEVITLLAVGDVIVNRGDPDSIFTLSLLNSNRVIRI